MMQRTKTWGLLLAAFSLAAVTCAIPGRGGAGASALPLTSTESNPGGGYSYGLPDGWAAQSLLYFSIASEDPATLTQTQIEALSTLSTPVFVAIATPNEILGVVAPALSPEEILQDAISQQFGADSAALTLSQPRVLTVGGHPAASIDVSGDIAEAGQMLAGRMVAVRTPDQTATFAGVAPEDQWDAFSPTFDAMVASVQFFPPDTAAGLEGFLEDLEGDN